MEGMEDFFKGDAEGVPVKTADIDLTKKIKQSNRLIEANYHLSEREQRFILLYISQLDKNAPDFCQIELSISQIKEALKLGQDYPKVLWDIADNIMEKVLTIRRNSDKESWYKTHWVQSIEYNGRKQTITLCFDKILKPDLLQLQEAYVSADTALCLQFKGKYAPRLYMLIRQYLRIGNRLITIEQIIQWFELSGTYTNRISDIKRYIIEPAIEQIKERSDIDLDFEYIKENRRIIALRVYNIRQKEQEKKEPETEKNFAQSLLDKIGDNDKIRVETDSNYDMLVSLGLYPMIAKKIIAAYDKERIAANIDYVKKQKGIVKKVGYLLAAIADDYASTAAEMKRIKDEEKERERQKIQERLEAAETMKNLNTMIANTAPREVPQKFRDFLANLKKAA